MGPMLLQMGPLMHLCLQTWVQFFEADFLSFLVEFYNDRQEIENLISLPKMHNCQSSKEIELLKPFFGLFLVDEYCIVNLMNAILGVLKVFSFGYPGVGERSMLS